MSQLIWTCDKILSAGVYGSDPRSNTKSLRKVRTGADLFGGRVEEGHRDPRAREHEWNPRESSSCTNIEDEESLNRLKREECE